MPLYWHTPHNRRVLQSWVLCLRETLTTLYKWWFFTCTHCATVRSESCSRYSGSSPQTFFLIVYEWQGAFIIRCIGTLPRVTVIYLLLALNLFGGRLESFTQAQVSTIAGLGRCCKEYRYDVRLFICASNISSGRGYSWRNRYRVVGAGIFDTPEVLTIPWHVTHNGLTESW